MLKRYTGLFTGLFFLLAAGCAGAQQNEQDRLDQTAVRGDIAGKVKGNVIFTENPGGKGVKMILSAKGLKGAGFHGIHIHENPVCEGDFSSAGGHYNPTEKIHGAPEEKAHHVGDLGNFKADESGTIVHEKVFDHLSLNPEEPNYVGDRALVIHAKADDYSTQPSGASGSRIGCAVLNSTDK